MSLELAIYRAKICPHVSRPEREDQHQQELATLRQRITDLEAQLVIALAPTDPPATTEPIKIPRNRAPLVAEIIQIVGAHFGIALDDLTGDCRVADLAHIRQIGYYLARLYTGRSFPYIGDKFGGRDHTTVYHGYKKVMRRRDTDTEFDKSLCLIEEKYLR